MTSTRQQLADALAPLLPDDWRIVPYRRDLDGYESTVVKLHEQRQEPLPESPQGADLHTFEVLIISGFHIDSDSAEDDLSDAVYDFRHSLRALARMGVRDLGADSGIHGADEFGNGGRFAWAVRITVPSTYKQTQI